MGVREHTVTLLMVPELFYIFTVVLSSSYSIPTITIPIQKRVNSSTESKVLQFTCYAFKVGGEIKSK